MTKRDTYLYEAYDSNGKKVKIGITKNPDRREKEHVATCRGVKRIVVNPYPCSEVTARKRERKAIAEYKRNHNGRKPRCNKEWYI